jgi:hypothetical protein
MHLGHTSSEIDAPEAALHATSPCPGRSTRVAGSSDRPQVQVDTLPCLVSTALAHQKVSRYARSITVSRGRETVPEGCGRWQRRPVL